jgi:hypothetical protein
VTAVLGWQDRFLQDNEPQSVAITNGKFQYSSGFIEFEGTFGNNTVSGTASTTLGCPNGGSWSATPAGN